MIKLQSHPDLEVRRALKIRIHRPYKTAFPLNTPDNPCSPTRDRLAAGVPRPQNRHILPPRPLQKTQPVSGRVHQSPTRQVFGRIQHVAQHRNAIVEGDHGASS